MISITLYVSRHFFTAEIPKKELLKTSDVYSDDEDEDDDDEDDDKDAENEEQRSTDQSDADSESSDSDRDEYVTSFQFINTRLSACGSALLDCFALCESVIFRPYLMAEYEILSTKYIFATIIPVKELLNIYILF